MPKSFSRTERVADAVHQCVARVIRSDFKDPRVGMITVLQVAVTPDLKHAKIYVSVLEDKKISETIKILNNAAGFFRTQIANNIQLRVVPMPHFIFDDSVIRGNRMERILESVARDA